MMLRQRLLASVCATLAAGPALAQEADHGDRLPEIDRSPVEDLATDDPIAQSIAAQQMGNLATTKTVSGVVGDLGDVMVLLHSQIILRLRPDEDRAAGAGEPVMPEDARQRLDELARDNDEAFAVGSAEWVVEVYPDMIEDWKDAGEDEALQPHAEAVVEQLEGQQSVAQQIAAAGGALDEVDEAARQTLSWGGGMDQGDVAQQPGDQSEGITTELPQNHEPDAGAAPDEGGEDGTFAPEDDETVQPERSAEPAVARAFRPPISPSCAVTQQPSKEVIE